MGTLTDFFVASKKHAAAVDSTRGPVGDSVVRLKNVDPVKLAELAQALGVPGTKDPIAWMDKGLKMIAGGDEGPWIHELAAPLVKALAALDAAGTRRVATAWSKTETCRMDKFSVKACGEIISSLSQLARQAQERKEMLLVWMCL